MQVHSGGVPPESKFVGFVANDGAGRRLTYIHIYTVYSCIYTPCSWRMTGPVGGSYTCTYIHRVQKICNAYKKYTFVYTVCIVFLLLFVCFVANDRLYNIYTIYIYTHTHIYMYIYIFTHTQTHTYTHIRT